MCYSNVFFFSGTISLKDYKLPIPVVPIVFDWTCEAKLANISCFVFLCELLEGTIYIMQPITFAVK